MYVISVCNHYHLTVLYHRLIVVSNRVRTKVSSFQSFRALFMKCGGREGFTRNEEEYAKISYIIILEEERTQWSQKSGLVKECDVFKSNDYW